MHATLLPLPCAILLSTSLLGLAGCSDPPPKPLFDEEGVWSLVEYDIGDGLDDIDTNARKDAFLLKFNHHEKVVSAAACTSEENGERKPDDSPCIISPQTTEWACRCFAYAFQEEVMQWQEFPPGTAMPPKVKFDPDLSNAGQMTAGAGSDSGGSGSGGSGGGGEGGPITVITTSEVTNRMDTIDFRPLPQMLFGADVTSHFIFERRAVTIFDRAYMDDQGRKAYCEPCITGMP
jgi:hypothetical protein